jgi:hypothetical protein
MIYFIDSFLIFILPILYVYTLFEIQLRNSKLAVINEIFKIKGLKIHYLYTTRFSNFSFTVLIHYR